MGRKKRKVVEEKEDFWCYFCDRQFTTEMDLVDHQNQRHFKCVRCGKRMANVYGLCTHTLHVHKTSLVYVPNALEGRDDINVGRNVVGVDLATERIACGCMHDLCIGMVELEQHTPPSP